jgi:hypothetical protein
MRKEAVRGHSMAVLGLAMNGRGALIKWAIAARNWPAALSPQPIAPLPLSFCLLSLVDLLLSSDSRPIPHGRR